MARFKKLEKFTEIKVDMTPMIDVVFNLIIFFMLVNQMVQEERATLELPIANEALEEKTADRNRLIINVHRDGTLEIGGERILWRNLPPLLFEEAEISKNLQGYSERSILIRADKDTPYKYIQKVFQDCAQSNLYKIAIGATIP